jgi:outer membrane assembly lipoprotein YfiO
MVSIKFITFSARSSLAALALCSMLISGCKQQKGKEDMSLDELSTNAKTAISQKKQDKAIGYLEEIVARFKDSTKISKYKMLLAELYFENANYLAAQDLYENFNQFYPADHRAEYAKYKSVMARFYQTLNPDLDQVATDATLALCQEYLANPSYAKYRTDVQDIIKTCHNKLIEKEVYVFNYYLKQGKYEAAKGRIKYLRERFVRVQTDLEPRLLYLEAKLAKDQHLKQEVKDIAATIAKTYPKSQYTQMAVNLTRKTFEF